MSAPRILAAATAAFLTGCQTQPASLAPTLAPAPLAAGPRAVDAWLLGAPRAVEAASAPEAAPLASTNVTAALLGAAIRCVEEQAHVISANIANASTPAYKRAVVQVSTASVEAGGNRYQVPVVERAYTVFAAGALEVTDRCLDVAIDGVGLSAVRCADGQTAYTRDGSFQIDAGGRIVTHAGHVVTPTVTVPLDALEVSIDPAGVVSGRTASAPDVVTQFGRLGLHRFVDPSGLRFEEGLLGYATERSGRPAAGTPGSGGFGVLKQGFREGSNVDVARELVNLQLLMKQQETLTRALAHFGMIAP